TEWSTLSVPPATYLEVGVLCEILCLAFGLGYKSNRIEKLKNETEILNLQLKIENISNIERLRSELSRDLHDDIGSTLSSINILSRTTRNNLQSGNIENVNIALEKINERSQRLLEKMSDIIWNIKPDNDSLVATMSRMREYSTAVLDAQNVHYNFDFPPENDDFSISLKIKSTLYLIFKEAVNNLIKYAHCSHVKLTLKITHQSLYFSIEDNGIGFDIDQITHQGGLLNMQHRAEEVNGTLYISSQLDQGTQIELSIPLTHI
ncbi:MAG: ATP-binding protein, partial [Saprospiraceae bacterium]